MKPYSAPELLARVRAIVRRHVRGELPMAVLELGVGYRLVVDAEPPAGN
jgi:DNA-binding response OmpR family regulator